MIYLGSPYSHPDPKIRGQRHHIVAGVTADLIRRGFVVFSPIVHCHDMAVRYDLPTDFEFWRKYCLHMLDLADQFFVLELKGWNESKGLTAEVIHWNRTRAGEPIIYISEDMKTSSVHGASI